MSKTGSHFYARCGRGPKSCDFGATLHARVWHDRSSAPSRALERPSVSLPELYLSKPGVHLPAVRVDNAEIIRRVRARLQGHGRRVRHRSRRRSSTSSGCARRRSRYLEPDERPGIVADYAVAAAKDCLEVNDVSLDEVDLVICGSIARQYFEPATAMEVAAKLGLKRTHAFDVTAACVGHLEAIQTAAGYLALHDNYRTALVCTSELSGPFLSYDIQNVRDLQMKTAGLTIGNAAACMLLRRKPFPSGGIRLKAINTFTAPDHWHLCQVPIGGTLVSSSVELMRLGKYIPPWVKERLGALGLTAERHRPLHLSPAERDHGAQDPRRTSASIPSKGVYTHALYGNTASASIGVTYRQLLEERRVKRRRQAGARQRRGRLLDGHGDRRVDRALDLTSATFRAGSSRNASTRSARRVDRLEPRRTSGDCLPRSRMSDRSLRASAAAGLCSIATLRRRAQRARAGRPDAGARAGRRRRRSRRPTPARRPPSAPRTPAAGCSSRARPPARRPRAAASAGGRRRAPGAVHAERLRARRRVRRQGPRTRAPPR